MKNDTNLTFINNTIKNSHAESCGGFSIKIYYANIRFRII